MMLVGPHDVVNGDMVECRKAVFWQGVRALERRERQGNGDIVMVQPRRHLAVRRV